ncbi:MAG: hydroxymethylglutaryl-CoA lyase [Anaerolineae bacterium]|nr:hydroxymethylglutaryl-CoA lyase [Anaerolineae bacterium]
MFPSNVTIVEVGPRDGFQMEKTFIPTDLKVDIINTVAAAGVRVIEATSFVNPKVIPQMADSAEVLSRISRNASTHYTALIPNAKGAQRAIDAKCNSVRLVVCSTETYNQRNVGMSVAQSIAACDDIIRMTQAAGIGFEVIIALAFGCPFEGHVAEAVPVTIAHQLAAKGITSIGIADSIGTGNPVQVRRMMSRLRAELPHVHFSMHIHDTRGLGLANVFAALECGIDTFDSSIGGLGGCPIMVGGTGNVPTEDVVNLCEEIGIPTGIHIEGVCEASRKIQSFLGRALPSAILRSGTRRQLFKM